MMFKTQLSLQVTELHSERQYNFFIKDPQQQIAPSWYGYCKHCLEQIYCRNVYLTFIPFLTLEPFPLLLKPEQNGHAVKSLMTIPAKFVQFRMLNYTTKTKESLHIYGNIKYASKFLSQRCTPLHKEEYAESQDLDLKSDKTWSLSQQLLCVPQPHYLEAIEHMQGPIQLFTKTKSVTTC